MRKNSDREQDRVTENKKKKDGTGQINGRKDKEKDRETERD